MQSAITRRVVIAAVAALFAPATSVIAQTQYVLQKADSYALGSIFNATSGYGNSPLSIAVDNAGNAYVGGYNSTSADGNVGIVKISGALSGTGSAAGLASTQFLAPSGRGLDALSSFGGDVLALHDAGGSTSDPLVPGGNGSAFIERVTGSGSIVWQTFNPGGLPITNSGLRVSAMAVDPGYVAGGSPTPAVAMTAFGQGRLGTLDIATGVQNFEFSQSVDTSNKGPVINATPPIIIPGNTGNSTNHRALAFDAAGNVAYGVDAGFATGKRIAGALVTTDPPEFSTLDGTTTGATGLAIQKTDVQNNVGNGITFLQGAATDELIAFSARGDGTGTGKATTLTAGTGQVQSNVQTNYVQLRQTQGQTGYLTQTALTGAEDGLGTAYNGEIKNFATGVDANGNPALYVIDYITKQLDVYTIEPRYSVNADSIWSAPADWTLGIVPNSRTTNATFGNVITAPRTVTLDSDKTVKQLKFDSTVPYTIGTAAGTNVINLTAPANDNLNAYITVLNGSHTVNAPIVLGTNARFDVNNAADTLTINTVSGNGKVLQKRGLGTMSAKNVRVNTLSLDNGLVKIRPNATEAGLSRVGAITLGVPATLTAPATVGALDLTNNGLIVDYDPTAANPYSTLTAAIAAGTIVSSTLDASHVLGIVDYSLTAPPTFTDTTLQIDTTSVFIRYTLKGDSNLDQKVNFNDLVILAQNYNGPAGELYQQGDSNGDGLVNFNDLVSLAQNYNQTVSPSILASFGSGFAGDWALAQALAPEPTTLLLAAAVPMLLRRRRA